MQNKNLNTKYIFVTGGVISGVGKGTLAASIGAIIKAKGLKVSIQKCDPYFNVDAGMIDPREHGECFVTADGAKTDLDLGHYERFLDMELTGDCTLTSGKLYKMLIDDERAGKFEGKTVQMVPHVTGLIQQSFLLNAKNFKSDVHIVEVGGTVGDLEQSHFIEAIREFPAKVGRENCFYVHVVFVPYLSIGREFKTKPAQNALRDLREFGIIPDMVAARVDMERITGTGMIPKKLATFCGVGEECVVVMPNVRSVYEVPLNAVKGGMLGPLDKFVDHGDPDMSDWEELVERIQRKPSQILRIRIIGKYVENPDAYLSVVEALKAAGWALGVGIEIVWSSEDKEEVDGVVIADGKWIYDGKAPDLRLEGKGHPEFRSRPMRPHPVFEEFIKGIK
ncbi:CTP synthase [Candidatus Saccharibacteria bacterium]|nr:CTP synthase [Candidatus Saccharibacteria bacterium]